MREEWPVVAVVHNHPQAETLRLTMESEGIEAILDRQMNPNFTLIDSEFRLRVRPDQVPLAREKLREGPFSQFAVDVPSPPTERSRQLEPPRSRDELLLWKLLVIALVLAALGWWIMTA